MHELPYTRQADGLGVHRRISNAGPALTDLLVRKEKPKVSAFINANLPKASRAGNPRPGLRLLRNALNADFDYRVAPVKIGGWQTADTVNAGMDMDKALATRKR